MTTEAAARFQPVAAEDQITVKCMLPNQSVKILAEKDLILNLLFNLFDNAKKASSNGDSIWVRTYMDGTRAVLEVEDHGRGIPAADQPRVFESFYMADKVRNRRNKGVGLGLSICSDILKSIRRK